MRALSILLLLASASWAAPADEPPALWQERYFFDALLTARDRMARQQSDPAMIPVLKMIAAQVAQQVANTQQIGAYVKSQQDNLRYAFAQPDPAPSLATIQANFETLANGAQQIRHNLYYLTARCRIASTQALPDPEMYKSALVILGQVQQLQLQLNALYTDAVTVSSQVNENRWAVDKFFLHKTSVLLRNVIRVQDSIFAVYNAGYELSLRSR
jgi:hypothetical protein